MPGKGSSNHHALPLGALLLFGAATFGFAACSGDETEQESLCDAGSLVFCKCRGGGTGTKECNSSGDGFADCISDSTLEACTEVPDNPTGTGNGTGTGTGSGTGGSGGGGNPDGKSLLAACEAGGECKTGVCVQGFCTQACGSYEDCVDGDIAGECIKFDAGTQVCAPYCGTNDNDLCDFSECAAYGNPSACGVGTAADGLQFAVCGDWEGGIPLPPDGTECAEGAQGDCDCNFGNNGVQRICSFGTCITGCYIQDDCPVDTTCSSGGSAPGTCE